MGQELRRVKKRRETLRQLQSLDDKNESVIVIHYSCESFYDRQDGSTPRITSIATRNLASGQTESFSIHKVAEQKGIPLAGISAHYNALEKEMLDEFSDFLIRHARCSWVHWNMRDINYGFQAIEHRHKVLGGSPPPSLSEERKFDLARAMIAIYGITYVDHPRLESIVKLNHITNLSFLNGQQEGEAFEKGEYVKLHQSTLRKVDILANLFERALQGGLKTKASFWHARGIHPKAISELIAEHWAWSFIVGVSTIGGIITLFK